MIESNPFDIVSPVHFRSCRGMVTSWVLVLVSQWDSSKIVSGGKYIPFELCKFSFQTLFFFALRQKTFWSCFVQNVWVLKQPNLNDAHATVFQIKNP